MVQDEGISDPSSPSMFSTLVCFMILAEVVPGCSDCRTSVIHVGDDVRSEKPYANIGIHQIKEHALSLTENATWDSFVCYGDRVFFK